MKIDYKIDYKAITAAHFTTFTATEHSRQIIARNQGRLQRVADNANETFSRQALSKIRNSLIGSNINSVA